MTRSTLRGRLRALTACAAALASAGLLCLLAVRTSPGLPAVPRSGPEPCRTMAPLWLAPEGSPEARLHARLTGTSSAAESHAPSSARTSPGAQSLDVGVIEKTPVSYKPTADEAWSSRNLDNWAVEDLTVGVRYSACQRDLQTAGGLRKNKTTLNAANQESGGNLLTRLVREIPVLGTAPLRNTGRGVGLELGRWETVGVAFELPRESRLRADTQPAGGPTVPVLSVNYDF